MQLRQRGYGCYGGPHFIGCVAYTDDLDCRVCSVFANSTLRIIKFNSTEQRASLLSLMIRSQIEKAQSTFLVFEQNQMFAVHLGNKLDADSRSDDLDSIIDNITPLGRSFQLHKLDYLALTVAHFMEAAIAAPQNGEVECCMAENSEICLEASLVYPLWSVGRFI